MATQHLTSELESLKSLLAAELARGCDTISSKFSETMATLASNIRTQITSSSHEVTKSGKCQVISPQESQTLITCCFDIWKFCSNVGPLMENRQHNHQVQSLLSMARDLFELVLGNQLSTQLNEESVIDIAGALLKYGRGYLGGDANQAEWYISNARQIYSDYFKVAHSNNEKTLVLHSDILLSCLQLAISNKQQAAQANFMHHLKALGRASGFHPEIVSRVALGVAGLQVEAALVLLHDNPKEAARVLQEAFSFVEDQKAILQQSIADLVDDFQRNCVKNVVCQLHDMSLQVLRLLLTSLLDSKNNLLAATLACSYLNTLGLRIGSPEGIEGPRLSPADSSQVGQGNDFHASVPSAVSILVQDASPPICWDIWLFSVRARLNLPEHTQVELCTIANELMRVLRFGCGLDVPAAGLKLLLQRSLVTVWSESFLDDVKDIVVTCAELYGELSADAILHATKWLLEAEEEGSSFASKALDPASGIADESLLENNHNLPERLALQILAEDIIQTSVTQKKKELHSLLHSYGALQYEQGNFKRSRGLFIAALHYAPASQYGSSARMVAASSKWLGSFDDALAYIDLAEQHDPGHGQHDLLRLHIRMCMGEGSQQLLMLFEKELKSTDLDDFQLQSIITEALACTNNSQSNAMVARKAVEALRSRVLGRTSFQVESTSTSTRLRITCLLLSWSGLWLQAWSLSEPDCCRPGNQDEDGGTRLAPRVMWVQAGVQELDKLCSLIDAWGLGYKHDEGNAKIGAEDASCNSLLLWITQAAMHVALVAQGSDAWSDACQAYLCCMQIAQLACSHLACPNTSFHSSMQNLVALSASSAASILVQRCKTSKNISSHNLSLSAHFLKSLLLNPTSSHKSSIHDSSQQEERSVVSFPDMLLIIKELIQICEKMVVVGQGLCHSNHQLNSYPALHTDLRGDMQKYLSIMRFYVSTYQRDEGGQKQSLQALLECPGLKQQELLDLAYLCLEEEAWRNVPMACAILGFLLRTALQSELVECTVTAQAVRTLYQLSHSEAIKVKVLEKALCLLERRRGMSIESENSDRRVEERSDFSIAEVQWLSYECHNQAVTLKAEGEKLKGSCASEREAFFAAYLDLSSKFDQYLSEKANINSLKI